MYIMGDPSMEKILHSLFHYIVLNLHIRTCYQHVQDQECREKGT
jgi:hypothetical protein